MKIRNAWQSALFGLLVLGVGAGCTASRSVSFADTAPGLTRARMADSVGDAMYAMSPAAGEYQALVDREAGPAPGGHMPADASDEQAVQVGERQMIYRAVVHVVVPDIEAAQRATEALAVEYGGHLQALAGRAVTVRIPAPRFREALREVEGLGEVSVRDIQGTDVTDEMVDLDIRLNTLREMRERLVALLDRADKVEDLLAIEKELQRVTVELERLQGRIQVLRDAVGYSTLTVHFNTAVPLSETREVIPFAWIRGLERDTQLRRGMDVTPERRWFPRRLPVELPADSVVLERRKRS